MVSIAGSHDFRSVNPSEAPYVHLSLMILYLQIPAEQTPPVAFHARLSPLNCVM